MTTIARVQRRVTALVLAALLVLSTFLVFPLDGTVSQAQADEVSDAQAVLKEATAKLEEIQKECDELNATVERLQSQIDETADSALELQETLTLGRNSLGQIANYEYRMGSFDTMVGIFLGATSFQEFTRNMDYLNLLARNQAAELTEQTARKQQYDSTMSLLGAQKDTQEDAMGDLEEKKAEAEKVVAEATAKLQDAEAAQALKSQAQAIASTGTPSTSPGGSSAGGAPAEQPSRLAGRPAAPRPTTPPERSRRPVRLAPGTPWGSPCACPCPTTAPTTGAWSRYPTTAAASWPRSTTAAASAPIPGRRPCSTCSQASGSSSGTRAPSSGGGEPSAIASCNLWPTFAEKDPAPPPIANLTRRRSLRHAPPLRTSTRACSNGRT